MLTGNPARPLLLIVEPDLWAHHAQWLTMSIKGGLAGGYNVHVLTQPDDKQLNEQLVLQGVAPKDFTAHAIVSQRDEDLLEQALALNARLGCARVFFPFLDRFLPILALRPAAWAGFRGKLGGIWFHPHALDMFWRWCPPLERRSAVRGRLHRFFRNKATAELFRFCFVLDPLAADRLREVNPFVRTYVIPDPYEREPDLDRDTARRALGLPVDRRIFLHLGSPEKRKGLPDVLTAFGRLNITDHAPLLVRVGPNHRLDAKDRDRLAGLVTVGRAVVVDRFVPTEQVMNYFSAADWVLIPYRKFRYSSGILANAIGARRPVIASLYGYIGREVQERKLGRVYRHGSVSALVRVLHEACDKACEYESSAELREMRSPTAWQSAFLDALS